MTTRKCPPLARKKSHLRHKKHLFVTTVPSSSCHPMALNTASMHALMGGKGVGGIGGEYFPAISPMMGAEIDDNDDCSSLRLRAKVDQRKVFGFYAPDWSEDFFLRSFSNFLVQVH
ncbi:hypothetical protein CEXT_144201 [Caerostris extrusa]|uniref:Uncharacterized protein n=1 Tax=Caerostris extrusa TaxID=172846 RepID=A0AAV4VC78_CAEEX|nr:hypothetical protein CEXT_144201 [Caerostris extrusa]